MSLVFKAAEPIGTTMATTMAATIAAKMDNLSEKHYLGEPQNQRQLPSASIQGRPQDQTKHCSWNQCYKPQYCSPT